MIDANVAFRSRSGGLVDRFFDRVMFPIFDEQGRCIAFGGRALDKEKTNAKYLNSSETPSGGLVDRFFDRVMFPIFDEQGRCIAFGGRALDKEKTNAKYLNSSETPIFHKGKNLYGFNWAKDHIVNNNEAIVVEGYISAMSCWKAGIENIVAVLGTALTNLYGFNWAKDHIVNNNEAIVVEGYISAMSCWKAGIENIVAVLGTALTENHVKTLMRFTKKIVYMFDGDAAGQKAARRAVQFIEKDDLDLRCVILHVRR